MKKCAKYTIIAVFMFLSFSSVVLAESARLNICQDDGVLDTFKIAGIALYIIKVIIPILLTIFGMIDLGKAVIGNDSDGIQKAASSLIKKAIAAVVIFLLPVIIDFAFSLVDDLKGSESDFTPCEKCLVDPQGC